MDNFKIHEDLKRSDAAKKIAEALGVSYKYAGAPTMAYLIDGGLLIDREGKVGGEIEKYINVLAELTTQDVLTYEGDPIELQVQEEAEETETSQASTPDVLTIAIPIETFTSKQLENLFTIIYARGELISKATGCRFFVDSLLMEDIKNMEFKEDPSDFVSFVDAYDKEMYHGIGFSEDCTKLIFTFDHVPSVSHSNTYGLLAESISRMAKEQKRAVARPVATESEKYGLRIWLLRMGWIGEEYRVHRVNLLRNLTGSAAFKNEEEALKWRAARKEGRKHGNEGTEFEEGTANAD